MPTVVSIVPYKFLPAKTGGQKAVALFYKHFSGFAKLVCLTVKDNDNTAAGYETCAVFPKSRLRYINPANIFTIRNILKKKGAKHLLIEHPYFGWLGVLMKKFTRVKLIVRSHNIEGMRFKTIGKPWWKILWRYEKWTHRNADYNFFITGEDLSYAVKHYGLDPSKCLVVTYGIEQDSIPDQAKLNEAKSSIKKLNGIKEHEKLLFFNGAFNYAPNIQALNIIAGTICPLLDSYGLTYKVIVCGPWLSDKDYHHPNLIIKGFVDAIEPYFLAADVFINPVTDGGGIKTKLVEALGYNLNAVSTEAGASGVDASLCNGKLVLVKDNDWESFARQVVAQTAVKAPISSAFYDHFSWRNIAKKAAAFIDQERAKKLP